MNEVSMEEILKAVSTVGFPIAITAYVMIRLENTFSTKVGDLTTAINKLIQVLAKRGVSIDD